MLPNEFFRIGAIWERRGETADMLSRRLKTYMSLARPAVPDELKWCGSVEENTSFDMEKEPDKIAPYIERYMSRSEDGVAEPLWGFNCHIPLVACDPGGPIASGGLLRMNAGKAVTQNTVSFFPENFAKAPADPRLLTYDAMKTHMFAMIWSFQPCWCTAEPARLDRFLDGEPYIRPVVGLSWMVWLNPALARLMTPPERYRNTIVEPYSDGSLFMAACKETFDCDSNEHLRKARAIHRQIDPLNFTTSFDGVSGRSDRVPPFPKI